MRKKISKVRGKKLAKRNKQEKKWGETTTAFVVKQHQTISTEKSGKT